MQTAEIPQFTLAKVGPRRDRERKKGGMWFWLNAGGATPGGVAGLGTEAGTGGLTGLLGLTSLAAKAAVALLLGALAVSAYNLGRSLAPEQPQDGIRAFVPRDKPAGADALASGSSPSSQASGLSMVEGSLNEGAAPNAGAADAAKEPPAAAAPDATAAVAPAIPIPAVAPPPPTTPPPASMDPAAAAGKFSTKFGQLSTGGGQGSYPTLAGGPGMSVGTNGKFDPMALGKTHVFAKPATARRAASRPAVNGRRDRAFQQLRNASNLSRAGMSAGGTETAQTSADMPFSNNPSVAAVVTGGGAGVQDAGGAGANDGGPIGNNNNNGGATQDPGDASHQNATPWSNQARQAAGALLVASILIGIAKFLPGMWGMIALAIAAMLGAFAMGLGHQVAAMGGGPQGKLLVAGGAAAMGGAGLGAAGNAVSSAVMVWTGVASGLLAGIIGAKGLMGKLN